MEVGLYRPEIPPNTGNISRLCVCTGVKLHIIGPPAFSLADKDVRRAGLDYWHLLDLEQHASWNDFLARCDPRRILLISKFGPTRYTDFPFTGDEILVFGSETSGLPPEVHNDIAARDPARVLHIPMKDESRSLNLSNSVALVVYEALRQTQFQGFTGMRPVGS